ncbi:MAG: 50S ribosomal protein L21 [Candidatus Eisenbacteria bacterium]|nr:50S ribosomal protein L21 [Candidatus Eisenbacteria bacterium]
MYAIVNINGIQTRVAPDETLDVARLSGEPGAKLEFDQVLLLSDGEKITVGRPYVEGASLTAEVVDHHRGEKLRIFKFKRRSDYRRRRGYRDELTRIRVTGIQS